jgi:undecaprenyl phosphate-alpha-L-ara4N flippase subunit ArnE
MLLGFVVLMTLGQVLFKQVALTSLDKSIIGMVASFQMIAALTVYAVATVLWVAILRTTPLSVAYPFAALAIVLVSLVGAVFFGEHINWRLALGTALIVSGIIVANA